MSFGFAVGDFITVGKLIADISSCLNDASGAAHQYQHLVLELENLQRVLREIDKLPPDHDDGDGDDDEPTPMLNAIKATALSCRLPLDEFRRDQRKYEASLGVGCSMGRVRDVERRVQWALGKRGVVEELRRKISGHVGGVNMLLGLYQIKCVARERCRRAAEAESARQGMEMLEKAVVRSSDRVVACQDRLRAEFGWAVVGWILPSVKSVRDIALKIWERNEEMFELLQRLSTAQNPTPPDARFNYFQTPVIFEDGLGRKLPVLSEYDWDVIDAIIHARFKSGPGSLAVQRGRYTLFDLSNRAKPISKSKLPNLIPGQHIVMALILSTQWVELQCPIRNCQSTNNESVPRGGMVCQDCNAWFYRGGSVESREGSAVSPSESREGNAGGIGGDDGADYFRNIRLQRESHSQMNAGSRCHSCWHCAVASIASGGPTWAFSHPLCPSCA